VKEMAQSHEYLSIEYSEEEVWLTWTDRNNEHHEKSVRQLAQEARAGNAHDENVLSYYRCPRPLPTSPRVPPLSTASCSLSSYLRVCSCVFVCVCVCVCVFVRERVCVCICTCMCVFVCAHMCACICMAMYVP
jgi:hypothetical protein